MIISVPTKGPSYLPGARLLAVLAFPPTSTKDQDWRHAEVTLCPTPLRVGALGASFAGELVEDRTVRPFIALAVLGKRLDGRLHALQRRYPLLQVGGVPECQGLHIGAASPRLLPERELPGDLLHRKAEGRARPMKRSVCTTA